MNFFANILQYNAQIRNGDCGKYLNVAHHSTLIDLKHMETMKVSFIVKGLYSIYDLPSVFLNTKYMGNATVYSKYNKMHRKEYPSVILKGQFEAQNWYMYGKNYRENDLPNSIITDPLTETVYQLWIENDLYHREIGPAMIVSVRDIITDRKWYRKNVQFKEDGSVVNEFSTNIAMLSFNFSSKIDKLVIQTKQCILKVFNFIGQTGQSVLNKIDFIYNI